MTLIEAEGPDPLAGPRGQGRPSEIDNWMPGTTPEDMESGQAQTKGEGIIAAMRAGAHQEVAARFADIEPSTLSTWLSRGRKARNQQAIDGTEPHGMDERYMTFLKDVEIAKAACEIRVVTQWQNQIPKDWRAAEKFLAKRFPERWKDEMAVGVQVEGRIEVGLDGSVTDAAIIALAETLALRAAARRDNPNPPVEVEGSPTQQALPPIDVREA